MSNYLTTIQFDDEGMGDLSAPASVTRLKETLHLLVQNQNTIINLMYGGASAANVMAADRADQADGG